MWPAASEVSDIASASFTRPATVKKKLAPNACAMRRRLPRFIGLEIPSVPAAKYPRIANPPFAPARWVASRRSGTLSVDPDRDANASGQDDKGAWLRLFPGAMT